MRLTEKHEKQQVLIEELIEEKNMVRQYLGQLTLMEEVNKCDTDHISTVEIQFEFLLTRITEEKQKLQELDVIIKLSHDLESLFVKDLL